MKPVTFRSSGSADHVGALVHDDQHVIDASAAEGDPRELRSMQMRNRSERCIQSCEPRHSEPWEPHRRLASV